MIFLRVMCSNMLQCLWPAPGTVLNISNPPDSIQQNLWTDRSDSIQHSSAICSEQLCQVCLVCLQDDMGELGLLILEKAYGRFDTGRSASLDKLQFTQVPHSSYPQQGCTKHCQDCSTS